MICVVSGPVSTLIILPTTDTSIHITWSLPKAPNGIITAYSLTLLDLKNNNVL